MSNEKRTVFANGHVFELPVDLESPCERTERNCQCNRRSFAKRAATLAKRVAMFVGGFYFMYMLLQVVSRHKRIQDNAYEYMRLNAMGYGHGDVAHHGHPHWDNDRPGHHDHLHWDHGYSHPPHHWEHHGEDGYRHHHESDSDVTRHRRPHPHRPHHGGYDDHENFPHHGPHRRPHSPHHGHDHDAGCDTEDVPRRRPHLPYYGHDHDTGCDTEDVLRRRPHLPYHHGDDKKPSHYNADKPKEQAHMRPRPKPITSVVTAKPTLMVPPIFSRINKKALNQLSKGELSMLEIDRVMMPTRDICIPTVPVSNLEKFTFNPAEFGKIVNKVIGGIGSDIHVITTTDDKASLEVTAVASSEKLAEEITVTQTTDSDGMISFQLNGPKWLGKSDCAFASVVLKIPETTTALVALRNNFVYGSIKIDRNIAHAIAFGDFEINSAIGSITVPPIRANNVVINSVAGGVHGYFHVSDSIAIHTVRGRIDAGVNVRTASKSSITAESVSGDVSLRVAGGFDGEFVARAISKQVEVEDVSGGLGRLHFDKDFERVKSGTFSPADSTRVGDSSLRATAVSGRIEIEFE
ncbi:hypothetical protein GGH96_002384 [Coemansia sp. RSA 1972]|nr:hypothetical protein GGH96_002384 [Coemansia sp. RSA 1972]